MKEKSLHKSFIIFLFMLFIGCSLRPHTVKLRADIGKLHPEIGLRGWEINESNTGLRGDYSKLAEFNLKGADAGKGYISYGSLYINKGLTITNKIIRNPLNLSNGGITIDHCLIKPISIDLGIPLVTGGNATILDSEIDGSLIPDSKIYYSFGVSSFTGVIKRCVIHGASSGIWVNNTTSIETVAENNYIYGLRYVSGTNAHIAGLTIRRSSGSGGVLVKNNRLVTATTSSSGPCFIQAWQGYIDNVLIEGNLLQGYGYSISLDPNEHGYGDNMRCINNRIDPWNGWTTYVLGGKGWREWKENYIYNPSAKEHKGKAVPGRKHNKLKFF